MNASTQLLLIIGHPIAQTLSPGIFNPAFAAAGVNMALVPLDVPPEQLPHALALVRHAPNIAGALLTVPHKLPAFAHIDQPSPRSRALGLVNILKRDESTGKLAGDAVDGEGFCAAVRGAGFHLQDATVLVIGCGGAGGASAWDALAAGAALVGLFDTAAPRAAQLHSALAAQFGEQRVQCVPQAAGDWDCVLNASPLGMKASDPLPAAPEGFAPRSLLVDATTPAQSSRWLSLGQARGHVTVSGRQFNAGQVLAMARFFGLPAAVVQLLAETSLAQGSG